MSAAIFSKILPNLPKFNLKDYSNFLPDYPRDQEGFDITVFDDAECIPMPVNKNHGLETLDENQNEVGAIEGGLRDYGLDILAFYKSYRNINEKPFAGKWGIFFVNKGIEHISQMIDFEFPGNRNSRKIAIDFLWHHEIFHAKFDVGILGFEALTNKHIYLPQKYIFRYSKSFQPEEALANSNAWKFSKSIDLNISRTNQSLRMHIPGISDFFYEFMKNQVGAYSRFDENNFELRSETAAGIFKNKRYESARCDELAPWIGLVPSDSCTRNTIPKHLVLGINYHNLISPARFIPKVNEVVETNKFLADIPAGHKNLWINAKKKLYKSSCLPGLDFKCFTPPNIWSTRINDNFRAHLSPISIVEGKWEAIAYGNHKKMGHG